MFRKRTYEVTLSRPVPTGMNTHRLDFKKVEVEARSARKASYKVILSTPGIWSVWKVKRV